MINKKLCCRKFFNSKLHDTFVAFEVSTTVKLEVSSHLTCQRKSVRLRHPMEYGSYVQVKCGEIRLENRNITVQGVVRPLL
jgi:hypothetical protein